MSRTTTRGVKHSCRKFDVQGSRTSAHRRRILARRWKLSFLALSAPGLDNHHPPWPRGRETRSWKEFCPDRGGKSGEARVSLLIYSSSIEPTSPPIPLPLLRRAATPLPVEQPAGQWFSQRGGLWKYLRTLYRSVTKINRVTCHRQATMFARKPGARCLPRCVLRPRVFENDRKPSLLLFFVALSFSVFQADTKFTGESLVELAPPTSTRPIGSVFLGPFFDSDGNWIWNSERINFQIWRLTSLDKEAERKRRGRESSKPWMGANPSPSLGSLSAP